MYKGKVRITMNLHFDRRVKVPADYSGNNKIIQANIGKYMGICNENRYTLPSFTFRDADDCTKDFIRYGGQVKNKENVWNAYMKLSVLLYRMKTGGLCQHHYVKEWGHTYSYDIHLCCCPKWSKDSKYCVKHSHKYHKNSSDEF